MMSDQRLSHLQDLPLFGALSDAALVFLLAEAGERRVPAGSAFFEQGEVGESMFVLLDGSVEVHRSADDRVQRLAVLGPGECFGEMALIECAPRSATVRAVQDTTALELRFDRFQELYSAAPEQYLIVQMNIAREVSRRLRMAGDLLSATRAELESLNAHGLYM